MKKINHKPILILAVMMALVGCEGCQQDPPPRTSVFIADNDYKNLPPQTQVDAWYKRIQNHIAEHESGRALGIEPPIVYITDDTRKYCGKGAAAIYCAKEDMIAINFAHAKFEQAWNHEFIHYVRTHIGTQETGANCHQPEIIWQIQWPDALSVKPKHNPAPC